MKEIPAVMSVRLSGVVAHLRALLRGGVAIYDEGYSVHELARLYPHRFEPDTLHSLGSIAYKWQDEFAEEGRRGWLVVRDGMGGRMQPPVSLLVTARLCVVAYLGLLAKGSVEARLHPSSFVFFPGTATYYLPIGKGQDYRMWVGVDTKGRIIMRSKCMVAPEGSSLMISHV